MSSSACFAMPGQMLAAGSGLGEGSGSGSGDGLGVGSNQSFIGGFIS
eukprot:CAMPEP_0181238232 /NCGR_PEP_ID=MMETSP1096-20121128/39224_1 /TAXON_ID=156174 ORGANISM="Chrysochromulina ericina, Strain CCMP281" /NCGR_SAMPLE_ID=MMETSP1096 /ASSEMBLY_ACC=CAM_ASM_000453 /LENGTH=46 /DNA_ID= /DNA_START= /DNA_END= /DNA_ORIENTATION=